MGHNLQITVCFQPLVLVRGRCRRHNAGAGQRQFVSELKQRFGGVRAADRFRMLADRSGGG
jgi:hypothetical protein